MSTLERCVEVFYDAIHTTVADNHRLTESFIATLYNPKRKFLRSSTHVNLPAHPFPSRFL